MVLFDIGPKLRHKSPLLLRTKSHMLLYCICFRCRKCLCQFPNCQLGYQFWNQLC